MKRMNKSKKFSSPVIGIKQKMSEVEKSRQSHKHRLFTILEKPLFFFLMEKGACWGNEKKLRRGRGRLVILFFIPRLPALFALHGPGLEEEEVSSGVTMWTAPRATRKSGIP